MTTIRRILYATDLSPASEPAWDEALRLGRLFGAEIVLVHVVPPVPIPIEGYFPPQMYQELAEGADRDARAALEALVARAADPRVKLASRVEEGPIAQRILDVARDEGADVIVVGTHGRTGFGRVLMGSIADRVVRLAPCPVLTARPQPDGPRPARAGIARVLYATDFSPASRAAWPWAVALAEAAGAELDLLHVTAQPVPDRNLGPELIGRMAKLLEEQGQVEAERFLQGWQQSRQAPGAPAPAGLTRERIHVLVGRGVVDEQIVHWAGARSADLIVMGTHGWSGFLRWMLGSVAHHVVQMAPCPVLTVGPEGQGEERPHAR